MTADDEIHALREKQHALEEVQRNSQSILDQNEQLNSKVSVVFVMAHWTNRTYLAYPHQ